VIFLRAPAAAAPVGQAADGRPVIRHRAAGAAPVGQAADGRPVIRHRQLDKRRLGARSAGTVRLARRAVGAA